MKKLVSAFHKHIDNCTKGTAIDVVVRAGWWLKDQDKLHDSVEGLGNMGGKHANVQQGREEGNQSQGVTDA